MDALLRSGLKVIRHPQREMLSVNRTFGSVRECERTWNQQFEGFQLQHGRNAFTPVNARGVLGSQHVNTLIDKSFRQLVA